MLLASEFLPVGFGVPVCCQRSLSIMCFCLRCGVVCLCRRYVVYCAVGVWQLVAVVLLQCCAFLVFSLLRFCVRSDGRVCFALCGCVFGTWRRSGSGQ